MLRVKMIGFVAGCACMVVGSGCVSLDGYRRLQASHRSVSAEKETVAKDLFDARTVNDSLRTRVGSLEREMETKDELVTRLRRENEVLDEMRKTARSALEDMADKQVLGDITIGSKLPEALDNALKRFADEHPTAVTYDAPRGTVKWKADLLFAIGSDVVKQSSMAALRSFTEVIKSAAAADFEVIVVGHTDNRPIVRAATKAKHPTNWHLSAHRAISVAFVLQKEGYSSGRVGVMGYGEHRPAGDNATEAGSSQNRRVEIYLVPRGAIVEASADAFRRMNGAAVAFRSASGESK